MNAGMYGMSEGQPIGSRRLTGRIGYGGPSTLTMESDFRGSVLAQNITPSFASTQVRTRVISVFGRGAVRALYVGHITDQTTGTYSVDILIDGVSIGSRSGIAFAAYANYGSVFFGSTAGQSIASGRPTGVVPDYVPFNASFEVFITTSGTGPGTAFSIPHWIDIHQ